MSWPRGIAPIADDEFAVADSANSRIVVFSLSTGYMRRLGEGQLDGCAAVAYNRLQQQFVVSDRYNNRVVIFDLHGRFVRAFGSTGNKDGQFNEPWGVAYDDLGLIHVVDKVGCWPTRL